MIKTWLHLLAVLSLLGYGSIEAQVQPEKVFDESVAKTVQVQPDLQPTSSELSLFEPPVRLTFAGKPIEVEFPGYACPTMVDFSGQGVFDLVVGQFSKGNMQHFRNAASAGNPPEFSDRQWLMTKNSRAEIPGIRCCTSSTPQFVDWNGDGRLDVLSGCYATPGFPAGHIVLLLGETDFQFSLPIYLTGSRDERLQNADYGGPGDDAQRLQDSLCTHQQAIDFDQDGDLDLIVGSSSGSFFLYENIGNALQPELKQPPLKLSIQSPANRSAPHCVDWNRDGLVDLLTGGSDGGVYLSLNRGTATKPLWSEFETLVGPSTGQVQLASDTASDQIQPGHSSRVWAFDWNGDGKLDLLVGDCLSLLRPASGVANQTFLAKLNALQTKRAALESIEAELSRAVVNGPPRLNANDPIRSELHNKLDRATAEFRQLESVRYQWSAEIKTGFVWLYLQK